MENIIDKVIVNIQKAYALWGWWSLLIIGLTFLIMIGVNALVKFLFRKATSSQMQGLRKALSSCSVFAVAIGVIYLFGAIDHRYGLCGDIQYTTGLVISNSAPVAFCAMSLWAIIKAVGRVGVLPLCKVIWDKIRKPFQKILEQIPLDKNIRDSIFAKLDEYLSKEADTAKVTVSEYISANTVAVNRNIAVMLSGFADTATVAKCTELFINAIKEKYQNKGDKKNAN